MGFLKLGGLFVSFMSGNSTRLGVGLAAGAAVAGMAAAMGTVNNVFQRDGEVSIGVTYMTGALVKLGQQLAVALSGWPRWNWLPYLMLWLGLVAGAMTGGGLFAMMGLHTLWIAVAFSGLLLWWSGHLGPVDLA